MTEIKQYDIRVHVKTEYLPSESDEDNDRFVFAYTITVENHGSEPAKLLSRHWIITDAENRVQEVKGKGVIGEQPHLKEGESFSYTSGTMIETKVGSMQGTYQMIADDGHTFNAEIKPFTLAIPGILH
ncbi:Co2+/Mg2+ efflux protein ApaG [Leucothrix pacifica]|uniref:Protein ApaG n=1 Tax=Leucothrix pacifica TaxID=1247513 RepID=A0A317CPQ4_9GAMM|nr:Co2+/Mg2+ efflux protein ApaG [Leucothrix pacifica]PWR00208.1 Co2+/Mg2+ efflux protein ApaG [Leucothrix pacifica]